MAGLIPFPREMWDLKNYSSMKELERGRLFFYVKFKGGVGYLDVEKFKSEVLAYE